MLMRTGACLCMCMCREDIHLAAVDMHVAPALTQHLKEQPQLRAAVRSMIAASTSGGLAVVQVQLACSGCVCGGGGGRLVGGGMVG
jgi:hypothetical protein